MYPMVAPAARCGEAEAQKKARMSAGRGLRLRIAFELPRPVADRMKEYRSDIASVCGHFHFIRSLLGRDRVRAYAASFASSAPCPDPWRLSARQLPASNAATCEHAQFRQSRTRHCLPPVPRSAATAGCIDVWRRMHGLKWLRQCSAAAPKPRVGRLRVELEGRDARLAGATLVRYYRKAQLRYTPQLHAETLGLEGGPIRAERVLLHERVAVRLASVG